MKSIGPTARVDLIVISLILAFAYTALVALDGDPAQSATILRWVCLSGIALATCLWPLSLRFFNRDPSALTVQPTVGGLEPPAPLWTRLAVPALLFAVTWVVYFVPLHLHFWGGCDEQSYLREPNWSSNWLSPRGGRPLLFTPMQQAAAWFFAGRIEGFIWWAFGLCFLNGLLLKAIVDRLLPGASLVGVLAAILLIANRSDPLRYMVMWSALYYLRPLFWFLLGTWLMLRSYDRNHRVLLVLSCLCASIALLTTEGIFPLMTLVPVLLWFIKRDWSSYFTWAGLWCGTTAVLAIKFAAYLIDQGASSYQARQLGDFLYQPQALIASLLSKAEKTSEYFEFKPTEVSGHIERMIVIALLVVATIFAATYGKRQELRPRAVWSGLAIALLALILGYFPFLHLKTHLRTQFFAAPAQAAALTLLLLLVVQLLIEKVRTGIVVTTVAVVVAGGAVQSYHEQSQPKPIYFAKTVRVFEQLHAISPEIAEDTLILYVLDSNGKTPLGVNYHIRHLSNVMLRVNAGQLNYEDPVGENVVLTPDGVDLDRGGNVIERYGYDKVIAFDLSFDGSLMLLEKLPDSFVSEFPEADRYDPVSNFITGPIEPLPYLRLPYWLSPIEEIFQSQEGILLGQGWSERVRGSDRRVARDVQREARLFVNPRNSPRQLLEFEVEPLSANYGTFVLTSDRGEVVSQDCVAGRQTIRAQLDTPVGQVARLSLAFQTPDAGEDMETAGGFRVYSISLKPLSGGTQEYRGGPISSSDEQTRR